MRHQSSLCLASALRGLSIAAAPPARPLLAPSIQYALRTSALQTIRDARPFSSTALRANWLEPRLDRTKKMMKGRPRVRTGGSMKGTTMAWGDYGLRMIDHDRRISAAQLSVAEDTIKQRLRGEKYRLYKRVNCNVGVYVSGNEMRMGKGKGSFDHWATRVSVNRIVLELRGLIHEQVVRDAFRLAAIKLPGQYKFVKRGEPPVVGITKLDGVTLEELKRPRRKVAAETMDPIPAPTTTLESPNQPPAQP